MPILPLLETVVYPWTVVPLAITQPASLSLIDAALAQDGMVGLVARRGSTKGAEDPLADCFRVGTIARIHRLLRLPDGSLRIAVEGLARFALGEIVQEEPWICAQVQILPDVITTLDIADLGEQVVSSVCTVLDALPGTSADIQAQIQAEDDFQRLSYLAAQAIMSRRPLAERQALLEQIDLINRLEHIATLASEELTLLQHAAVMLDSTVYHGTVYHGEVMPLAQATPTTTISGDVIIDVAWARQLFAQQIIGYEAISEVLISYLAVYELRRRRGIVNVANQLLPLCLIGAAGTGKSVLIQTLAEVSQYEYRQIAADTLVDANSLARILLDVANSATLFEIDGIDRLDPQVAIALATAIDSGEFARRVNSELKLPEASLRLIATARNADAIAPLLRERFDQVQLPIQTEAERFLIARDILLPAICNSHALHLDELAITDATLHAMLDSEQGPGMQGVAQQITRLCRIKVPQVLLSLIS